MAKYIITPQRYGAPNIVVLGTSETFEAHGAQALKALESDENVERIVLWNTDGHTETDPKAQNGYFVN